MTDRTPRTDAQPAPRDDVPIFRAEMGHYSSVVGNSVHLNAPEGHFAGQVMIIGQDERLREKDTQAALLGVIKDALNRHADHRSFPGAADGRPLPPMGDELMIAGISGEDARFVANQLAQNGLTLVRADQPARAGMVKPLEWEAVATECERAETILGRFEVMWGIIPDAAYLIHGGRDVTYPTPEAAKAAAQADYERRILAALLPTEAGAEPVRWQRYNPTHDVWLEVSEDDLDRYRRVGQKVRPLYATPPAAQVTEVERLKEELRKCELAFRRSGMTNSANAALRALAGEK